MKFAEILDLWAAMRAIDKAEPDVSIPLAKNITILKPLIEAYNSSRNAIVEKYLVREDGKETGIVQMEGGQPKQSDPYSFNKDIESLLAKDVEVDGLQKVSQAKLGTLSVQLSPVLRHALMPVTAE